MRFFKDRKNVTDPKRPLEGKISSSLQVNIFNIKQVFTLTPNLIFRDIKLLDRQIDGTLVYLQDLADVKKIEKHIIPPLCTGEFDQPPHASIADFKKTSALQETINGLLKGNTILFLQEHNEAYIYNTVGGPSRTIEDSIFETTLKGSHLGFGETTDQNIALLQQFIPSPKLKAAEVKMEGDLNRHVYLVYLEGTAKEEQLAELTKRIKRTNGDQFINIGQLAECIEDNHWSPFPQFRLTERPDQAAIDLFKGKICVVLDRSPSALIAPGSIMSFFQSVDDYTTRWMLASFVRILRFVAVLISIFLPALYISIVSFNYEIIPIRLLITIGESRAEIPFDPLIEALLMEITLEMLREAGIRLPAPVGQTVGIVGGIVIGQAAVEAGIVSNFMVIIVSLTAISSFIIPNYDMSLGIRLMRFPMMIIASLFGIVGIAVGFMTLIGHIVKLESIGSPYGTLLNPIHSSDFKDSLFRFPLWKAGKSKQSSKD
ncbi:spore germination protein [Cytobacillus gottheilii]|uniref:spore germination protein n=1 Tax=Cytobacillus gottheilii TaxID=859144 RepID=UPI0024942291|nr:spore germination protein [Cytobacillus gottheilii]